LAFKVISTINAGKGQAFTSRYASKPKTLILASKTKSIKIKSTMIGIIRLDA
jgi:hypothetical protein